MILDQMNARYQSRKYKTSTDVSSADKTHMHAWTKWATAGAVGPVRDLGFKMFRDYKIV